MIIKKILNNKFFNSNLRMIVIFIKNKMMIFIGILLMLKKRFKMKKIKKIFNILL